MVSSTLPTQAVVVGIAIALEDARATVEVLFEAEGIHRHGRATAGRAPQYAIA